MYNEDDCELFRTLRGTVDLCIAIFSCIFKLIYSGTGICFNLQHLQRIEGPDVWKKFAVCIVSDGRVKVSPSLFYGNLFLVLIVFGQANKETLNYAAANGFFDQGLMDDALNLVDDEAEDPNAKKLAIQVHLFEYTAQLKEVSWGSCLYFSLTVIMIPIY